MSVAGGRRRAQAYLAADGMKSMAAFGQKPPSVFGQRRAYKTVSVTRCVLPGTVAA